MATTDKRKTRARSDSRGNSSAARPLTRAERVVAVLGIAVLLAASAAAESLASFWSYPLSTAAALAATGVPGRLGRRSPWFGPTRMLRWGAFHRWAMQPTAPIRVSTGWRKGLALAMAAVGLVLVVAGLAVERAERRLISDLRGHGTRESAVAVADFNDRAQDAQVRFAVRDEIQVRALQIQDTVPQSPQQGDLLPVVYDATDPSRVMLVSQLTDQHRAWNYGVAGVGAALMVGALLLGLKLRRRLRRATEGPNRPTVFAPANDLRVGPNGELPRERRR